MVYKKEKKLFIERARESMACYRMSPATIKNYILWSKLFFDSLNKKPIDATNKDITRFVAKNMQDKSDLTLMLFLAAIRTCYKMVYQKDPTANIYRPKKYVKLPRILTKKEVSKVISKTNKIRDKLILSLMYGCGLRVGEIVNLKVEDINIKRGVGYITRSKVRRERMFVIPKKVRRTLKAHIKSQQNKNLSNLFSNGLINRTQRKMTTRGVQKMVKLAGKRVGVVVHPHLLRHTYATHLLESGTELWRIQRLMGHALMRSTEIYIHTSTKDIEGVKSPLDSL